MCFSLFFSGCSWWREAEDPVAATPTPANEFPFTTREPEVFQAGIVVRVGDKERRLFVARSGNKRRIDYDIGTDDHRAVLVTDSEYLLYFLRRVFVENPRVDPSASGAAGGEPTMSHLLHARDYSEFEEIGRDGSVVQFRARINESNASEALIFFDESVGLPVRQEFYSVDGEKKSLQYSFELQDFRREAEAGLFEIPPNFRRESARQKRSR